MSISSMTELSQPSVTMPIANAVNSPPPPNAATLSSSLHPSISSDGDGASPTLPVPAPNTDQESSTSYCKSVDFEPDELPTYKVVIDGEDGGVDIRRVHDRIEAALRARVAYHRLPSRLGAANQLYYQPLPTRVTITQEGGIYEVTDHDVSVFCSIPSWEDFTQDVQKVRLTAGNAICIKACNHRLGILQERSRMFFLLNAEIEERHSLRKAGGVFSSTTKVDGSVLLSECIDAHELLDTVMDCYRRNPEVVIDLEDGSRVTFRELLECHGVQRVDLLTVAGLGWQRDGRHRSQTAGKDGGVMESLGDKLLYTFTHLLGSLSGRVLKRVITRTERPSGTQQASEYAVRVYGSSEHEIADIAEAIHANIGGPYKSVQWVLCICFKNSPVPEEVLEGKTVQDQLDNLFLPLLKATIAPSKPENVSIATLLQQVGAMQIQHIQEGPEVPFDERAPLPEEVPSTTAQSHLYYFYYLYSNLVVLNSLRARKGLNTLQLRCAGGRPNSMDDLLGGYLLADVITRATKLVNYPVLQYLCGLHNIGLTLSPLCDHSEGTIPFNDHPLPNFLHRCLNVAIASESPLKYHHNPQALVEEYATAQKIFRLSALDMTELARNSVIMSSFPPSTKRMWLGAGWNSGAGGNAFERSQVTDIRLRFREESWLLERNMMRELYINPVRDIDAGLSRWHYLSSVQETEYNTVMDTRVRFPRTVLKGPEKERKSVAAAPRVARALDLRNKYIWKPPRPWETSQRRDVESDFQRRTGTFNEDEWTYAASDAVFIAYAKNAVHSWPRSLPTLDDFHKDLREVQEICASPDIKEFAHKRLENLEHKFRLHLALNHANEAGTTEDRLSSNRDFYQATKVDTHIHMAAGMTPKQILTFVLTKLKESSDDIAMKKGDEIITLGQLFTKAGITMNLTVDQLNVQADHTLFERFDNFNNKYNPMGNGDLRSLLLKTDNFMNGRYFAELIHDIFEQYSRDRYTYAENRVSVYGINTKEWDKLSNWFATHGMANKHNKWVIQVPRVYKVFRGQNVIGSFGQYLQNIFQPLWEASLHPSEHPTLHNFLNHVSGFDSVDNEATIDLPFTIVSPWAWTAVENPPYNYYLYYLYANIRTLNEFRASRGFSTFALRPHCGESGSGEHLHGAFLCANSICHGINLRNDPSMQYLYYLTQIGLHVSPLSNNALFLYFLNNPFPDFFRRGLNVSLSTDDPMMFHQTQEPLIEEYSIAARVWGLSANDLCEIARNSVLQCGFDDDFKREAIGNRWFFSSSLGNDELRTHLSDIRVAFRFETYHTELANLERCCGQPVVRYMMTSDEEREVDAEITDFRNEKVLLSTHDQAMEVMLRDIEGTREKMQQAKDQVDALRRQQRSLLENITEAKLQRQQEEEAAAALAQKVRTDRLYVRDAKPLLEEDISASSTMCPTPQSETLKRLLRWRPMPTDLLRFTTQANVAGTPGRPLPPLPTDASFSLLHQSTNTDG